MAYLGRGVRVASFLADVVAAWRLARRIRARTLARRAILTRRGPFLLSGKSKAAHELAYRHTSEAARSSRQKARRWAPNRGHWTSRLIVGLAHRTPNASRSRAGAARHLAEPDSRPSFRPSPQRRRGRPHPQGSDRLALHTCPPPRPSAGPSGARRPPRRGDAWVASPT